MIIVFYNNFHKCDVSFFRVIAYPASILRRKAVANAGVCSSNITEQHCWPLTSYQPLPSFWDAVSLLFSDERINVGWFGTSRVKGLLDVEEDKK
jgi:hypothetical protein